MVLKCSCCLFLWKMENKEEMLKQHTMELVYINDESNESSTELVFYLRHNKGTDTKTDVCC